MSQSPTARQTFLWIALIFVVGFAAVLLLRPSEPADVGARSGGAQVWPEGRWHVRDARDVRENPVGDLENGEELARVLSLPYTGAGSEAIAGAGVLVYDREAAQPGINLYTSGHASEAVLMDMEGKVLHRWRMPFERAFPNKAPTVETAFFRRAQLLPEGDLIAIYQGGGMVRLDARSEIVWAYDAGLYNDFHVARDGRIYGIAKEARVLPEIHPTELVLEDSIVVLSPEGGLERRISLLALFQSSPYADLLQPMADRGDIFHSNTVDLLEGERGDWVEEFPEGSVLVSLREVDIVAVVDLDREAVVWARRGDWNAQHQPELLANGNILLFDNQGAAGKTRVIEFEPIGGDLTWEYRGEAGQPLSSPEAGTAQRLDNGNTLITESERGRAVEVSPEGTVVWEFVSPHRAGARNQLVATLFEVLRLPEPAAAFLDED